MRTSNSREDILTDGLEEYGNENGTEGQLDKARALLDSALLDLSKRNRARFTRDLNGIEAYGNASGTEAQMDKVQGLLTDALSMMARKKLDAFFATAEVASVMKLSKED